MTMSNIEVLYEMNVNYIYEASIINGKSIYCLLKQMMIDEMEKLVIVKYVSSNNVNIGNVNSTKQMNTDRCRLNK